MTWDSIFMIDVGSGNSRIRKLNSRDLTEWLNGFHL
jgi:hypothetical protein